MTTAEIWDAFKSKLLSYIKARVSDNALAEDILQEVFIKIHLKSTTLKEGENLTSWLYSITRNAIIDLYRKKRMPLSEIKENDASSTGFDDRDYFDHTQCLAPFIDQLPDEQKDALIHTSYNNFSQKEYAEKKGIAYSTVKSRIQRGKVKLRELFLKCCAIEHDRYGNIISSNCNNC